ncbi:MAG: hypothetical protein SGARI_005723 [Bacillariaceae sp.]
MSSSSSTTQKFDIGGTLYTVSKSLLEQYPGTMLCAIASELWQNDDEEAKAKPIFIERDGQRFRYVLDFMRDGKVTLPGGSVSKKSLLEEFTYFGFQEVDPESIQVDMPFADMSKCAAQMAEDFKAKHAKALRMLVLPND